MLAQSSFTMPHPREPVQQPVQPRLSIKFYLKEPVEEPLQQPVQQPVQPGLSPMFYLEEPVEEPLKQPVQPGLAHVLPYSLYADFILQNSPMHNSIDRHPTPSLGTQPQTFVGNGSSGVVATALTLSSAARSSHPDTSWMMPQSQSASQFATFSVPR